VLPDWILPACLFFSGSVSGVILGGWWRQREEQAHVCRTLLRVADCVLIDCEVSTLVTLSEDDGVHELRDYVIMPRLRWDSVVCSQRKA